MKSSALRFAVFCLVLSFSFFPLTALAADSTDQGQSDIPEATDGGDSDEAENNDSDANAFELPAIVSKGYKDPGWKKTEIQSISRQTLTAVDLKEVPASFGDSINALTALPGIIRTSGGIFGSLVIRGADTATNNYFIDDIPISSPLHFGGLHSVISTNLMKDIDVYASAFPAQFNTATSAVINISTVDEVEEFGSIWDISLLSLSGLVKAPILRDSTGGIRLGGRGEKASEDGTENAGYLIASGRYGYISLATRAAEAVTDEEVAVVPEYWDYQFKTRYDLNSVNALTLLLFGHSDYIKIEMDEDFLDEGDDPLFQDAQLRSDTSSNSQGLYFDSRFSDTFNNRLLLYSTVQDTISYTNFVSEGAASWAKDISAHYKPWIFGAKEKLSKTYLSGHAEIRGALEYTYYHFTATGKTLIPSGAIEVFDPADEDLFYAYTLDDTIENHLYGGYVENELTYGGLTVLPGIRSEYLARMSEATFDPRLMTSYRFGNDITLSAAGGHYSYFFQTNPNYFTSNPDVAEMDKYVEPEQAWHLSVGGQKEFAFFTLKTEVFSNYFYNRPQAYPHYEADGTYLQGLSSGKLKAKGVELMLRKDTLSGQNGSFGWISYTYTRAKEKSGLPTADGYAGVASNTAGDEYGDQWTTSAYEQRHNVKLVGGYRLGNHTFSGRFQFYSGFPYTPYIAGIYDTNYNDLTGEDRYYPVTGERNSERFPDFYTLDFRYTHSKSHGWRNLSWYVELINVFMQKAENTQKWYYDRPYSSGSNPVITEEEGLSFMMSFGAEMKF
jgi:hypothetical protein